MSARADDIRRSLGAKPGTVVAVEGPNFSGRTRILRFATNLADHADETPLEPSAGEHPAAYIGPEISNSISGLASTVRGELRLHSPQAVQESAEAELVRELGLDRFHDRNPFTLSGGEQACLTIACALVLKPEVVAIDCALEQLDRKMKPIIAGVLASGGISMGTAAIVADNRLDECELPVCAVDVRSIEVPPPLYTGPEYQPLNPDVAIPGLTDHAQEIRIDGLDFAYVKNQPVLRDLSVSLAPGQPSYILGRNGAGKSTLAKLLAGVIRSNSGTMKMGSDVYDPWHSPGQTVAYHFQNPDLQLFSTTVEEEVTAAARIKERRHPGTVRRAEVVMAAFGLTTVRNEHPLDLPFVMRKRVALAATIAAGTEWVILDEPTLGQDRESSMAIGRIIKGLAASGVGVMIITHSESFLQVLPGRKLMMAEGALRED